MPEREWILSKEHQPEPDVVVEIKGQNNKTGEEAVANALIRDGMWWFSNDDGSMVSLIIGAPQYWRERK